MTIVEHLPTKKSAYAARDIRPPDLIDTRLIDLLSQPHFSVLWRWGISQKIAEHWLKCVYSGKLPTMDRQYKERTWESWESFETYLVWIFQDIDKNRRPGKKYRDLIKQVLLSHEK